MSIAPAPIPPLLQILEPAILLPPDTSIAAAIAAMTAHQSSPNSGSASCVFGVETVRLAGILTQGDVIRLLATGANLEQVTLGQVMSTPVIYLTETQSISQTLTLMQQHQIQHLPVLSSQGQIKGLITSKQLCQTAYVSDVSLNPDLFVPLPPAQTKLPLETRAHHRGAHLVQFKLYPDRTWKVEFVGKGSLLLFGFSPEELVADPHLWASRVEPEDLERFLSIEFDQLFQHHCLQTEYRFHHRDGSLRWIAATCTLQPVDGETYWNVNVVDVDITHQKQIEKQLIETQHNLAAALSISEARLVDILNFADVSITSFRYLKNGQWVYDYLSSGCETVFGYTPDDFLANPSLWELGVAPEDWQKVVVPSLQRMLNGQATTMEYRFHHKDGSQRWVRESCRPRPGGVKASWHVIAVATDITDLKQIQTTLEESEERFRTLSEAAPAGICLTDATGSCIYVNQLWQVISGLTFEESLGDRWLTAIHPDDREGLLLAWSTAIQQDQQFHHEFRLLRADGETRWLSAWSSEIRTAGGTLIGYVSIDEDITERRQTEIALQQAKQDLEVQVMKRTAELFAANYQLAQQVEREKLLTKMIQRIRQSLDLTSILNTAVTELQAVLQTSRVIVTQYREDGSKVILAESVASDWVSILGTTFAGDSFPGEIQNSYLQGQLYILNNCATAHLSPCLKAYFSQLQVKATLVVPILQQGKLWGLLISHQCDHPRVWQPWELELTQQLANQLAIAVQQSELYQKLEAELTERQRTETVLRESETELRQAQRIARLGSGEWDITTKTMSRSEEMLCLFGLTPSQPAATLDEFFQILHPDDRARVKQQLEQAISQRVYPELDYRIVWPDGSIRHFVSRAEEILDHQGQVQKLSTVALDVTNLKRVEAALKASEELFRSLSESAPIGIFKVDTQGFCQYLNPRGQEMMGATAEEAIGFGWQQFIHPDDLETMITPRLSNHTFEKREFCGELRFCRRDGSQRLGRVRTAPLLSNNQVLLGSVGTIEDITDIRAIEEMKRHFISLVSHELRTPLASISGSLGLLSAGILEDDPETTRNMLKVAASESDRLVRLVNDILNLERLESQQIILSRHWHSSQVLLQQAVDALHLLAQQNEITLTIIPCSLQVWCDGDRVIQTLVNLVSNAIKFSPSGTTVWLTATCPPTDSPPHIRFSVIDQGRGIPADKLESIFGRFQQVDASDSRNKGGTGLGLAICQQIIHLHGGKIWVESQSGHGSSFYFTLPLP